MKHTLKRVVCCILSLVLVLSSGISAFAVSDDDAITPIVVVNDIEYNPLINTDDNTVVFDFDDFEPELLFTTAFPEYVGDLFSKEVQEQLTSGDLGLMDMINLLTDYLGFSGDITNIVNKVLDLAMELLPFVDISDPSIQAIIKNIDYKGIIELVRGKLEEKIDGIKSIKMNDDGTPLNANIGPYATSESLEYYFDEDSDMADAIAGEIALAVADEIGYENTYVFTYDWRIDPIANAALLNDFIENIKDQTGAEKVSVISEGYGSTVATAYLSEYADEAADSVKNFVTVSSEFLGTSVVGDFFKGDIVNEFSNLVGYTSAFIRWTNDRSDNAITAFSTWITNYILNRNWEVQDFCLQIEKALSGIEFMFKMTGITAELAKMPGLWALVPEEDYEDAVANIYGASANEDYIAILDAYKELQFDGQDILVNAKDNGINVSVVAAWDIQILPIGENSGVQSDGVVDTAYASFGATCVGINQVVKAMKAEQYDDFGHDHMSSTYDMLTPTYSYGGICHYIDASTCALPENTWFIKNMKHNTFNSESNSMAFLLWLVTADAERTVWQEASYQQFMNYNRYINPGVLSSEGIVATDQTAISYLIGDINLDHKVTSIDSRIALRVAADKEYIDTESTQFKNGDVYEDGVINEADARKILLMSSGLIENMRSGIEIDYLTEAGVLEESSYEIELRPVYNPARNLLELSLVLLDAEDSYSANFAMKYDTKMFTYAGVDTTVLENGYVVAGRPIGDDGILTCSFSVSDTIDSECDDNGDLLLATFKLDVARKDLKDTTITAGAVHFYEDNRETFITPVALDIPKDFYLMRGDADNNRHISIADARTILRIAAKLEKVSDDAMFARCDVDMDGKITLVDARLTLRAAIELIGSYE